MWKRWNFDEGTNRSQELQSDLISIRVESFEFFNSSASVNSSKDRELHYLGKSIERF
jgi:hypothetical protein